MKFCLDALHFTRFLAILQLGVFPEWLTAAALINLWSADPGGGHDVITGSLQRLEVML